MLRFIIDISYLTLMTFSSGWTSRDIKITYGGKAVIAHNHQISLEWKTHGKQNSHRSTTSLWRSYIWFCDNLQIYSRVPDTANINLRQALLRSAIHRSYWHWHSSVMLLLPSPWKYSGLLWQYYDKDNSFSIWTIPNLAIQDDHTFSLNKRVHKNTSSALFPEYNTK
jgi:hypothetical protein